MGLGDFIIVLLQGCFLDFQLHNAAADIVQLLRQGVDFRTDHGAGFVHQVDGLIRQETIRNVTVGKGSGCNQGVVLNLHTVEHFVALLQTTENGNGVFHRRFANHDRLETALQCSVLFNVLPILVQGGCTDAVQLTSGQHRLQQVAGVHGTVCLACAYNGVQLINEQDDAAVALLDFRQHGLQTFLKFTTELGTCNQAAHVQGKDGAILQAVRHVASDDTLRQAFHYGGFTNAGLADQHRVVFRFPAQDADHVTDFAVTADDGIQLLRLGHGHQIRAVLLQGIVGIFRAVRGDPCGTPNLRKRLHEGVFLPADLPENVLHVGVGGTGNAQPYVLHGDEFVFHLLGAGFCIVQCLVQVRGDVYLVGFTTGATDPRNPSQSVLQQILQGVHAGAALTKQLRNQTGCIFR